MPVEIRDKQGVVVWFRTSEALDYALDLAYDLRKLGFSVDVEVTDG